MIAMWRAVVAWWRTPPQPTELELAVQQLAKSAARLDAASKELSGVVKARFGDEL